MIFSIDEVWKLIEEKEGQSLKTFSGLEFTYRVKGHEIFISRKDKSIKKALEEVEKLDGLVTGPKMLGVFGASYLYPIFIEIGVIKR